MRGLESVKIVFLAGPHNSAHISTFLLTWSLGTSFSSLARQPQENLDVTLLLE